MRVPIAAKGGEGPPLGRLVDATAGQPMEAFVRTSVYFVLKNSLSAASWPAFTDTCLLPHCFSKYASYRRVDGRASMPLTTNRFRRLPRDRPPPWIWKRFA